MTEEECRVHLRDHLTDGHWHDQCPACQRRRFEGGTGIPTQPMPDRPPLPEGTDR